MEKGIFLPQAEDTVVGTLVIALLCIFPPLVHVVQNCWAPAGGAGSYDQILYLSLSVIPSYIHSVQNSSTENI